MKPVWFLPFVFLALAIPVRGQTKLPSKVDSLLRSASERLNDYQQQLLLTFAVQMRPRRSFVMPAGSI